MSLTLLLSSMVELQPYEGAESRTSSRPDYLPRCATQTRRAAWWNSSHMRVQGGASLLVAPAVYYYRSAAPQSAAVDEVTEKYVIEASPKMQDCSSMVDSCMSTKCCQASGMKC